MKKFLVLGMGYVARKHVQAIAELGHRVVAVSDIDCNNLGWMDKYFPDAEFLLPEEINFQEPQYDYVSICTPNNTHRYYINKCHPDTKIICEKPVVTPVEANDPVRMDVNVILQLRHHPIVKAISSQGSLKIEYHTLRGKWYDRSWKSDFSASGGLVCNIGVHIVDLVLCALGEPVSYKEWHRGSRSCMIVMEYLGKVVVIDLDINKPFRRAVNDIIIENFDQLHTYAYDQILKGNGFKTNDALAALKLMRQYYLSNQNTL